MILTFIYVIPECGGCQDTPLSFLAVNPLRNEATNTIFVAIVKYNIVRKEGRRGGKINKIINIK